MWLAPCGRRGSPSPVCRWQPSRRWRRRCVQVFPWRRQRCRSQRVRNGGSALLPNKPFRTSLPVSRLFITIKQYILKPLWKTSIFLAIPCQIVCQLCYIKMVLNIGNILQSCSVLLNNTACTVEIVTLIPWFMYIWWKNMIWCFMSNMVDLGKDLLVTWSELKCHTSCFNVMFSVQLLAINRHELWNDLLEMFLLVFNYFFLLFHHRNRGGQCNRRKRLKDRNVEWGSANWLRSPGGAYWVFQRVPLCHPESPLLLVRQQ